MDFWGFEGRYRHELPGDGFGLFMPGELPPPKAPDKSTPPFKNQNATPQEMAAEIRAQEVEQELKRKKDPKDVTEADEIDLARKKAYLEGLTGDQRSWEVRTVEVAQALSSVVGSVRDIALMGAQTANAFGAGLGGAGGGGLVGTAGYGGSGGASASVGFGGGVGDLTGTGFGIQSSGGNYKEMARKLDAMIQQLMMAIAMGNVDAISSAITLLSMKSKTTMIQASLQVIGAMRQYDNQMRQLSDQMGALNSQNPNYQSQLAGLNSQFQSVSMGRQAIANTLRDVMGMVEEISTFEKSIYDVKSRTQANYARWT